MCSCLLNKKSSIGIAATRIYQCNALKIHSYFLTAWMIIPTDWMEICLPRLHVDNNLWMCCVCVYSVHLKNNKPRTITTMNHQHWIETKECWTIILSNNLRRLIFFLFFFFSSRWWHQRRVISYFMIFYFIVLCYLVWLACSCLI